MDLVGGRSDWVAVEAVIVFAVVEFFPDAVAGFDSRFGRRGGFFCHEMTRRARRLV